MPFEGRVRGMTETPVGRRRPYEVLADRWPTALAIVASALVLVASSEDVGDRVDSLGALILVLPLEYLLVTQIGRPGASFPVVGCLFAVVIVTELLDVVPMATVLAAIALVVLVWGAISGTPHGRAVFGVQAAGMLAFGALGLVSLAVDPDVGRYVVAAGWFLHGAWDLVHLKLDRVVSRPYAECCAVIDVLIAAQLVFLL
jgi:hypothetical protein